MGNLCLEKRAYVVDEWWFLTPCHYLTVDFRRSLGGLWVRSRSEF